MNDKEYILRGVCPDSLGLVAKVSNFLNEHNLFIKEAYVGKGLVMKRFHARARGRGARILKPFSHITILLSEQEGS